MNADETGLNLEENTTTGAPADEPEEASAPQEERAPEASARADEAASAEASAPSETAESPRAELEQEELTPEPETPSEVAPETAEPPAEAPAPEGPKRAWYVVHCYSGYENRVKKSLEQRIISEAKQDLIFRVVVPTEEEIDVREGQRKVVQRRVFPGYVLVEMIQYHPEDQRAKEAWFTIRNTPGVTGFVSSGDRPTPLREDEVAKILKRMETDQPKVRVTYRPGQVVHIIDGPFADFRGTVDEVNMEKGKVRVMVSFFGRDTPVELDLLQVEKV